MIEMETTLILEIENDKKIEKDVINNDIINDVINDIINDVINDNMIKDDTMNDDVKNVIINDLINDLINHLINDDSINNDVINDDLINDDIINYDLMNDDLINDIIHNIINDDLINDDLINDVINDDLINDGSINDVINDIINDIINDNMIKDNTMNNNIINYIINDVINDIINYVMNDNMIKDNTMNDNIINYMINNIINNIINDNMIKDNTMNDDTMNDDTINNDKINNDKINEDTINDDTINDTDIDIVLPIGDECKLKKRSSVEFNGMELICALVLFNRNITNFNNLIEYLTHMENNKIIYENILKFNSEKDFVEYVNDIHKKKKIINNYITQFKIQIEPINSLSLDNIKKIYISGKINKHQEIDILNNNLCHMEAKSDIYVELKDDKFVGLSVKQSKDATKSNYSVQKILGEEVDELLTKIKKNFLKEQGFLKFNKMDRNKVNVLFYPQYKENPYMNRLKEEIENKKENISRFLIDKLFCSNINYDIYEFDGTKLIKLIKETEQSPTFEEYLPYYHDKKGKERKTAKLFYKLTYNNKIYRVEVRWKGNIHNASPQFQIHEE